MAFDGEQLAWMQANEIASRVKAGDLTTAEIAEAMINRVESVNPTLNAIINFDPAQVRRDAAELDQRQADNRNLGPLHGVPFTIKDLTAVSGLPLTFGMRPFEDNVADHDAVIVERLRAAGGLFLGKTNTPESGYYGGTDNHLFGPTHNPWKHGHTAGGSSGGAAAAVASGLGPLAEGSDGAGSVRIPSAMCGVVGFKPSTGRIPQNLLPGRYFEWVYHGPITRTVADAALMLDVASGPDYRDAQSFPTTSETFCDAIQQDFGAPRVAWSPDLGLGYVDPQVVDICRTAVQAFADLGATVDEATPQWGSPEQAMWHNIWVPGYASEHDMFDWSTMGGTVDDNLISLMREGEQLRAVDVGRAAAFRGQMWDTFTKFMQQYDFLISPTLASPAFPLEQFAPDWLEGESLQRQILGWLLTYPYNMMTTPAITVPAGFTSDGRPVGLQIAGGLHADASVLRAAAHFEAARPWTGHIPDAGSI